MFDKKRQGQGQGVRSSENTEFRQGGMSSFCCECNEEMDIFLQTLFKNKFTETYCKNLKLIRNVWNIAQMNYICAIFIALK